MCHIALLAQLSPLCRTPLTHCLLPTATPELEAVSQRAHMLACDWSVTLSDISLDKRGVQSVLLGRQSMGEKLKDLLPAEEPLLQLGWTTLCKYRIINLKVSLCTQD